METKIYRVFSIDLHVVIDYNSTKINRIFLQTKESRENGKKIQKINNKTEKIPEKIKIKKRKIWKYFDSYFNKKSINNSKFYRLITENAEIFGKFSQFQQEVYKVLCNTNFGEKLTYKQLALLCPDRYNHAFQAIGTAMRKNRFVILIPCHRVLSSTGIGGYMGFYDKSLKLKNEELSIYLEKILKKPEKIISKSIKIKIALLYFESEINNEYITI